MSFSKKTIQMVSVELDKDQKHYVENLFTAHMETYNLLSPLVCSIDSYGVGWTKTRNDLRKQKQVLQDTTNHVAKMTGVTFPEGILPSWLWTMALQSAAVNRKSMDEDIFKRIKEELRTDYKMTADETAVVMYIVKSPVFFRKVIKNGLFEVPEKLSNKEIDICLRNCDPYRLHQLIAHAARRYRHYLKPVHTCKDTWMKIDKNGYGIEYKEGKTIISLHSLGTQKPFKIELKGIFFTSEKGKVRGNLTVVYDRDKNRLVFQRLVEVRNQPNQSEAIVGADVGMNSVLCTSHGFSSAKLKEQKIQETRQKLMARNSKAANTLDQTSFKEFSYVASDFLDKRGRQRNRTRNRRNRALKEADQIQFLLRESKLEDSPQQRKKLEERMYYLKRRARRIEKNNIKTNKRFHRQSEKIHERLKCMANEEIALVLDADPDIGHLVLEELEFRGQVSPWTKIKNRRLTNWISGVVKARIEYKAGLKSIQASWINPAYSSQYCHLCGNRIERDNTCYEIAFCPIHGQIDADINAAHNLLWMYKSHPEVTIWTPKETVRQLYEERTEQIKVSTAHQSISSFAILGHLSAN